MTLSTSEVRHIALLARLDLDDGEVERLSQQLSAILDHFDLLGELNTEGLEPTAHTLPLTNVMRDDTTWESWPLDEILRNAPRREDGYLRVRAVFE